jgi:fructokinase
VEGGGTKFVCAAGTSAEILESASIATTDPATTLAECLSFFRDAQARVGPLRGLGVACFGPIALDRHSARFGHLLDTPKPGWSGAAIVQPLEQGLKLPVVLDTDVGAAALGEWRLGAGRGLGSLAYVTVGTGIGADIAPRNAHAARLAHPEMGHIPVRRDPRDQAFAGNCPFHGDCLEGLASGSAVQARWGCRLEDLPPGHEGRVIIAGYLGQLAAVLALVLSVQRVVFGGGVMRDETMLPMIRDALHGWLKGYVTPLGSREWLDEYLVAPSLGSNSAIAGALLMAQESQRSDQ